MKMLHAARGGKKLGSEVRRSSALAHDPIIGKSIN
jgi:hypothetical protein